jgi:hypothetical protein
LVRLTEILALFPGRLRASTERSDLIYVRQSGCAVHNRPIDKPAPGAVLVLNDGQIAVYRDAPPPTEIEGRDTILTAVYAQQPSGALAVPTGLVFIRFRQGVVADARREQIAQAGYEIAEAISYAPQAAWLRACSGTPADALTRLSELRELPDVENVEPQLLVERAERT